MPYARPNRTSTTPRPAVRRPRRAIVVAGPQNPAVVLAQATAGWNFAVRVWLAFDPPSAATPNWINITGFVEQGQPITIVPGRSDGLSDVNTTTCTLTVDNSDGRFSRANPAGAWFGQIGKGSWLKVEVFPPSGVVSSRFVGFITSLPDEWSGQYQTAQISASDRLEKLGRSPAIISCIQSEVLTDPNLVGNVKSYWNLHETASPVYGQIAFGDTSGNLSQPLTAATLGGVPLGTGMGNTSAAGPGFDGLRAMTFNPVSTTQGTYLTGTVAMPPPSWDPVGMQFTGNYGTLEFWYQATTASTQQYLASIVDSIAHFGFTLWVDTAGYLNVSAVSTAAANAYAGWNQQINSNYSFSRVDDGAWHHIVLGVLSTSSSGGNAAFAIILDGHIATGTGPPTNAGIGGNLSQLIIGGGYTASRALSLGAANFSDVAWTWAPLYNWGHSGASPYQPDYGSHAAAGLTGFLGETTDLRIARVARYGGAPIPVAVDLNVSLAAPTGGLVQTYSQAQGAWTNLATGAHACGTQSMSGRKALDIMLEAAHTEAMPLYVDRAGFLAIQPSTARQNTSPAWTVNALDLDPSTQVADDFAYTTNQMTITPNGQPAQTVIGGTGSPGRLSLAKYDEADGSQSTASLNPVEAQSLGLSYIQLRADPPPRLAPLAIEAATLALQPGYGPAWYDAVLASTISTPVRVTNAPAVVGGGNYDCLIEGWTETITAGTHLFQFNVSPPQGPTYQLDDPVLGHLDTDGSTLAGSTLNTTALSFQVATTNAGSPLWTTSGADFPFDIRIDGEQITISGISGASSPQTFTASARSVNGVVATHSVGAAVSLWQPLTLAY